MAFNRKPVFEVVRAMIKSHNSTWVTFTPEEIAALDKAIDEGITGADPHVPATIDSSPWVLSEFSKDELKPVHPKLKQCVELAIHYSLVDFRVNEGERTIAEQAAAVRRGASKTMKSKHLKQADGFVWAVDLVAIVDGKVSWDFDYYYYIARAMDRAATELGIAGHIRWGAVWDRVLSDFGLEGNGDKVAVRKAYLAAVEEYKKRHAGNDFLDGPHFEWVA